MPYTAGEEGEGKKAARLECSCGAPVVRQTIVELSKRCFAKPRDRCVRKIIRQAQARRIRSLALREAR